MRKSKQFLSILIFALIMIATSALYVSANDVYVAKVKAIKPNQWVTQKRETYRYNSKTDTATITRYVYKISIPSSGYIKFIPHSSGAFSSVERYRTSKIAASEYGDSEAWYKPSLRYAVDKGTFYVMGDTGKKFKYTFTKAVNNANYSKAKAVILKKNTKKVIVQSPAYNYDRWYKITLTAKQRVTVTVNGYATVAIVDSKGFPVLTSTLNTRKRLGASVLSRNVLAKGTYYLVVRSIEIDYLEGYHDFQATDIKWK